jgi:hypothetical protein
MSAAATLPTISQRAKHTMLTGTEEKLCALSSFSKKVTALPDPTYTTGEEEG